LPKFGIRNWLFDELNEIEISKFRIRFSWKYVMISKYQSEWTDLSYGPLYNNKLIIPPILEFLNGTYYFSCNFQICNKKKIRKYPWIFQIWTEWNRPFSPKKIQFVFVSIFKKKKKNLMKNQHEMCNSNSWKKNP